MDSVTFIITVYNKAGFLPEVVAALRAQRGLRDPEFLFIDDGSTDDSLAVLHALTADLPGARVITKPNSGPAGATNRGIAEATRPWIKFVDGDDVLHPDTTARMLDAALTLDAGFVWCGIGQTPDLETRARLLAADIPATAPVPRPDALVALGRRMFMNPTCMLARTSVARDVGGCDERVFIQDYSLALRLTAATRAAEVPQEMVWAPLEDPDGGRASANAAQILHDLNLAMSHFLDDHPALPAALRRAFVGRAVARAWKWDRRKNGASALSRSFADMLLGRVGLVRSGAFIRRGCTVFRITPSNGDDVRPVRLAAAPAA